METSFKIHPIGYVKRNNDTGYLEIDAYKDSPVIDIKPYMPFYSRVESPRVPPWSAGWPEWMPDEVIGVHDMP